MPPRRRTALVCELHAHTRWSDGSLTLPELVDLYGDAGFDVLCVTDHVVAGEEHVHAGNHAAYLAAIDVQAARARERHGLLLLPGLELTDDPRTPPRPRTWSPSACAASWGWSAGSTPR